MLGVYILIAYLFVVWVLARLVVPHLGFRKQSLPDTIPEDLKRKIQELNAQAIDDLDFLKKSYEYVTNLYTGSRIKTITKFWYAFENPIGHKPGFMPCTGQNYLLRLMLVKSGRFQDNDIQIKTIPLNLFIHQYLRVKVEKDFIDVDPWSHFLNVPMGKKSAIIG
ncbi:MAG: hypothetical protein K0S38_873 [Candidatus Paceibacter sp.]|jgi:hypothetical protein|nr:hypothetical protein [Candidatus Paceibacter sp.]